MTTPARLPAAALATGAFCLTFLLGIGGASAIALWQQSSTATMTVKAGTWVPSVMVTCTNGSAGTVLLAIAPSESPVSLSYNVRKVGQAYTAGENSLAPSTTALTISLTDSQIIATGAVGTGLGNRDVNVRVTAGFQSSSASAEVLLRIRGQGTTITCG